MQNSCTIASIGPSRSRDLDNANHYIHAREGVNHPGDSSKSMAGLPRRQSSRRSTKPRKVPSHSRATSDPIRAQKQDDSHHASDFLVQSPASTDLSAAAAIPHKSPLQKLELTLDGISREEKRARIQEAELAAQDRAMSRKLPASQAQEMSKGHVRFGSVTEKTIDDRTNQQSNRNTISSLPRSNSPPDSLPHQSTLWPAQLSPGLDHQHGLKSATDNRNGRVSPLSLSGSTDRTMSNSRTRQQNQQQRQHKRRTTITHPGRTHAAGPDGLGIVTQANVSSKPSNQKTPYALAGRSSHVPTASFMPQESNCKSDTSQLDGATWSDRGIGQQRSSSLPHAKPRSNTTPIYDAYFDKRTGQTYFDPPIYLKCGPLLRFRGIHTEPSTTRSDSAPSQIWKGSVMIVTVDSKSQYHPAPVLRLFKQPIDMLLPPPAQIHSHANHRLRDEYVDPLAGQVKMSRVGKTLYVRPAEHLDLHQDLSRREDDTGLYEELRTAPVFTHQQTRSSPFTQPLPDGEQVGQVEEISGVRFFAERQTTFWKFNIDIVLGQAQERFAYRINRGSLAAFWIPAKTQSMNIVFHTCNGFSPAVDPNPFSGPDPLWRDVLNAHQTRPFHLMIGGGNQIYMDAVIRKAKTLQSWHNIKNPSQKRSAPFAQDMRQEIEAAYLHRYSTCFSQGFYSMANSQIPMVNNWDDHDIMHNFASYPDDVMYSPIISGIIAIAFKYYMLFQHQSLPHHTEKDEPSWLLGVHNGPFINQRSRSLFMSLGSGIDLLALDCQTERRRDLVMSDDTWHAVFARLHRDIVKHQSKHLLVLLPVPIAFPRLSQLDKTLSAKLVEPIKAVGRIRRSQSVVKHHQDSTSTLDNPTNYWTTKHHKNERDWFVHELQTLAALKSVRITILSGHVHLCAVSHFLSKQILAIPKDRDHRYMPNVISSAIVDTPALGAWVDMLNKRTRLNHLDPDTDQSIIPMFDYDVDGNSNQNNRFMPRRNWCSIREYQPTDSPPATAPQSPSLSDSDLPDTTAYRSRSNPSSKSSLIPKGIMHRFRTAAPPIAYYNNPDRARERRRASADDVLARSRQNTFASPREQTTPSRPRGSSERYSSFVPDDPNISHRRRRSAESAPTSRRSSFARRPTELTSRALELDTQRHGHIDLTSGLDIRINVENERGDPAGTTTDYRLLVPALDFTDDLPNAPEASRKPRHGLKRIFGSLPSRQRPSSTGGDSPSISGDETDTNMNVLDRHHHDHNPLQGWTDIEPHHVSARQSTIAGPVYISPNRRSGAPLSDSQDDLHLGRRRTHHFASSIASKRRSGGPINDSDLDLNHSISHASYPPPTSASPPARRHRSVRLSKPNRHDGDDDDAATAPSSAHPNNTTRQPRSQRQGQRAPHQDTHQFSRRYYHRSPSPSLPPTRSHAVSQGNRSPSDAHYDFAYASTDKRSSVYEPFRDEHSPSQQLAGKNQRRTSWKFWRVGV